MKKLPTVGLLVAASLVLCVPASHAQYDYVGEPGISVGADIQMDADGGAWVNETASPNGGPASVGSRDTSEYRASLNDPSGPGDINGQAGTGGSGNTTDKTNISSDSQYKHLDNVGQLISSPRNRTAPSAQWANQEMLYDGASTELLSLDSVSGKSVPSGSFNLGFKKSKGSSLGALRSGWNPMFGGPPVTSTSSCDFNVVDP